MLTVPAINCKFRGALNGPTIYMLLYNLILYRNRVMPCVRQTTPIADNHIHRIVLLLLRCWRHSRCCCLLESACSRGGGNDEEAHFCFVLVMIMRDVKVVFFWRVLLSYTFLGGYGV